MNSIDESSITTPQAASEPSGMVDLGGFAGGKIMMLGGNLFLMLNPSASSQTPTATDKDTVSPLRTKSTTRTPASMGWNTNLRETDMPFENQLLPVPVKDSPQQLLIEQQNAAIEESNADDMFRKSLDTTANMLLNMAFQMWQNQNGSTQAS